jgi:trimeric autotransporter adhesin
MSLPPRSGRGAAPAGRRRYAGWVALIFGAILASSAGPLYLLYGSGDGASAALAFGDAFADLPPVPHVRPAAAPGPPRPVGGEAAATVAATPATAAATPAAGAATAAATPAAAAAAPPRDRALDAARAHTAASDWDAALRAYDRLVRARPADAGLAVERARVLAWSGDAAAAALALAPLTAPPGASAELRLERARYLWWAGNFEPAEALLSEIIAGGGAPAEAEALRATVRASLLPSASVARRWLAESASPAAELWLARALVREDEPGTAVGHLRRAVDAGAAPRDSLLLELASVALSADSMRAAASALEQYLLETGSADRTVRLRLARAYAWSGETARAIERMTALLDEAPEPALFHERALLYVAADELALADADLALYLAVLPGQPDALALRADIARWRAVPPPPATAVALPRPPAWSIETESFGDSEAFRWHAIEAHRRWAGARTALGVSVRHEQTQGVAAPGARNRAEGYGAAAGARVQVDDRLAASAGMGLRYFTGAGAFAVWALGVETRGEAAGLRLRYEHEPAVRRASTAAALEARVRSHRLLAGADTRLGGWDAAGQLEGERLGSGLGTSRRLSAGAWLARSPLPGLSVGGGVSALTTAGAAPELPEWGPLYWMPRYYVAPALSLRYEAALGARVKAAARVAPAYAFVAERAGAGRRFPDTRFAASGLGLDLDWAHPAWNVGVAADWSGALEAGYRAAALRVRITPQRPRP